MGLGIAFTALVLAADALWLTLLLRSRQVHAAAPAGESRRRDDARLAKVAALLLLLGVGGAGGIRTTGAHQVDLVGHAVVPSSPGRSYRSPTALPDGSRSSRSRAFARCRRERTVPTGMPSTSAACSWRIRFDAIPNSHGRASTASGGNAVRRANARTSVSEATSAAWSGPTRRSAKRWTAA